MSNAVFRREYLALLAACKGYLEAQFTAVTWVKTNPYTLNRLVKKTGAAGSYYFRCYVAGTSGATEPEWPTTFHGTKTDGNVQWRAERPTAVYAGRPTAAAWPYVWLDTIRPQFEDPHMAAGNRPASTLQVWVGIVAGRSGGQLTWEQARAEAYETLEQVQQAIGAQPRLGGVAGVRSAWAGEWRLAEPAQQFLFEINLPWVIALHPRRD